MCIQVIIQLVNMAGGSSAPWNFEITFCLLKISGSFRWFLVKKDEYASRVVVDYKEAAKKVASDRCVRQLFKTVALRTRRSSRTHEAFINFIFAESDSTPLNSNQSSRRTSAVGSSGLLIREDLEREFNIQVSSFKLTTIWTGLI